MADDKNKDVPVNNTLSRLAHDFVSRSSAQGWKGKKRDAMCLEYFCGASQALSNAKHADADCVLRVTAILITTRGYSEVEALCRRPVAEPGA